MPSPRPLLQQLFETAVSAASPASCMQGRLPARPPGRIFVAGAGKAGASMARTIEMQWGEELEGLVIVPYGHALPCVSIEVVEAAHPVPDAAGVEAAKRLLNSVSDLQEGDTVVCLISGGGSSLLNLPAPWLSLDQKRDITRQLLRSGASIQEINCVRKKLSAIKGGKLAAACAPARVMTFVISDVPGNDLAVVASGPTIADATDGTDAVRIIDAYDVDVPGNVRDNIAGQPALTDINADEPVLLATADDALAAAAAAARAMELEVIMLGDLAGDSRALAAEHAALAISVAAKGTRAIIISGGETTVQVTGDGRGGRNSEYALALAIELDGHPGVHAIACDTDGIDGAGDNAGCIVTPDTLERARAQAMDALEVQSRNDSYHFFEALGDLVMTGPTLTNVNDFRALLIA